VLLGTLRDKQRIDLFEKQLCGCLGFRNDWHNCYHYLVSRLPRLRFSPSRAPELLASVKK
jgi:hypothetical protein